MLAEELKPGTRKLELSSEGEGIKTLTHKQMLQGLLIALAKVKLENTSQNVLNKIRQRIYFLCR